MPHRDIEQDIERLNAVRDAPPTEAGAAIRKALADRVNLVVAKGARLAAELKRTDLIPDLLRAFDHLLENGAERDPQCWGKNAIAKALTDLDHRESAPFLRGIHYVQMEPIWGKLEDMAQNLRGLCVLALVACDDLTRDGILRHLVDAMFDASHTVRVESVRALEQMEGEESALLLRLKARTGDEESAVTGQVFDSLLKVERRRAIPFVAEFLETGSSATRQEAALALGISRLEGTVEILCEALKTAREPELRQAILRGLGSSRQESAIEFLRTLAKTGRPRADAAAAREALELAGASLLP
jgi:HEAT repeat protein